MAKAPQKTISMPNNPTAGVTPATLWFNPYYYRTHGPYSPEMVPFNLMKIMRRDPMIALGFITMKSPIMGANYTFQCSNQKIADFIASQFERKKTRLLRLALNALDFGFQFFELSFEYQKTYYYDVMADTKGGRVRKTRRRQNACVLKKARDLRHDLIEFVYDNYTNQFKGINYGSTAEGTNGYIDVDRLWAFIYNEEFDEKQGNSLLLNAYRPFYNFNMTALFALRYLEKKGDPPLIGKAPPGQHVNESGEAPKSSIKYTADQLGHLRGGGVAILPAVYDEKGNEMYDLRELETAAGRMEGFIEHLNYWDVQKARSILIPEQMMVQMKQTGSYAQAETHRNVASATLDTIMKQMCDSMNEYLIPKMVKYEFGENAPDCRIVPGDISRDSQQLFSSVIEKLLQIEHSKDYTGRSIGNLLDHMKLLEKANLPIDEREAEKYYTTPKGLIGVKDEGNNSDKDMADGAERPGGSPDNTKQGGDSE